MKIPSLSVLVLFLVFFPSCNRGTGVKFKDAAQTEIHTPSGVRVYIDVVNVKDLVAPPTENDILLVTLQKGPHYSQDFIDNFPGEKLILNAGRIEREDLLVVGLTSIDSEFDELDENRIKGSNTIYMVQTPDFKIVHLGDIGQKEFTPKQLEVLKDPDLIITPIECGSCQMSVKNQKGFNLIKQLNGRLVIPTHFKDRGIEFAVENYTSWRGTTEMVYFKRKEIPEETEFIIMGDMAGSYGKIFNLPLWEER